MAGQDAGCLWIVGQSQRWDERLKCNVKVRSFCHKMTAPDSPYCPKHQLWAKTSGYPEKQAKPHTTYAEGREGKR